MAILVTRRMILVIMICGRYQENADVVDEHDDDDDNGDNDDRDEGGDNDNSVDVDDDLKTGGVFWFPAVHQEAENPRTSQHLILSAT